MRRLSIRRHWGGSGYRNLTSAKVLPPSGVLFDEERQG